MRIAELSERTGVSPHSLRRYEALGLIASARTSGNYRDYAEAVVREVNFIRMGREVGFPLARIAELLPAYRSGRLSIATMLEALRRRIAEVDDEIARQRALKARLLQDVAWFEARAAAKALSGSSARPTWPGGQRQQGTP